MEDRTKRNTAAASVSAQTNSLRFCWHIDGTVAGSARPGRYGDVRAHLRTLREEGINLIINLTSEPLALPDETADWFEQMHEPVLDGEPPDDDQLERIMAAAREAIDAGKKTLIHCRGGVGRTATVLVPLIMSCTGVSLDEAITNVKQAGRYTQSMNQWDFLRDWAKARNENASD